MEVAVENKLRYDKYKVSGVEWLGKIPKHWEVKRFKHVFNEKKKVTNIDLNCGSISFGRIVYKNDENIPEFTKRSYQVLSKGEFLINPLNLNYDLVSLRIALSDKDVVVSSGYIIINNVVAINKDYFKWLLHIFDVAYMKTLGSGVRQTLSFTHIANSEIAFPPLSEQQAIANFLEDKCSKIDAAIEIKQKQIALLKERHQIAIHQAVTRGLDKNVPLKDSGVEWIGEIPEHWEGKRLKNIFEFINRGSAPTYVENSDYKVINQATFSRGYFNLENIKYTYEKSFKSYDSNKGKVVIKDILLASTGGGVLGKVAFFNIKDGNYIADSHVTIIRGKPTFIEAKFYYYFFYINYDLINGVLAQGSTNQTELQREWLRSFILPQPPLTEQQTIVSHLEKLTSKIDTAISIKQQEIEKLKEYKISLINSAVTGKMKALGVNLG